MRSLIILMLAFYAVRTSGQDFNAEASLPAVESEGFYRILISPEVNTYLNNELSDIRIHDKKNHEVPYVFQKESPAYYKENFIEYEILKKEAKRGCCTTLTLRNVNRSPINNIHLVIKNADAWREASLLGSDDKEKWFAIKDHFTLSAMGNSKETLELKIVGFPWSNYEFYRLEINDSTYAPLNILKAGYYESQALDGTYTELLPKIITTDSVKQKKTFVRLLFDGLQFVDKVEVVVNGAKYYRRKATLLEKRVRISKKDKRTYYYNPIQAFELTSGRTAIIELSETRGQEFLIEIENEDNPPLTIAGVKAYQLNRYLTTWLKKDEQYTLKFGLPSLTAPVYDLAFFKDSIPEQIKVLKASDVKILKRAQTATSESFFTSKNIIWMAIVVVMLVLGYMSFKLVRESSQEQAKDESP